MAKEQNPNLQLLETTVAQLGELADEMVFLGGTATGLLITDPASPPVRVTQDVDVIVQVLTRADYYQFSKKLRECGFSEDMDSDAPICRWKSDNVVLDVMPTDPEILGFGNRWYEPAVEQSKLLTLYNGKQIRMVTSPYFLITKLEAFAGRGNNDYMLSHDIEDIIAVINGRPELIEEVRQSVPELLEELSNRFADLASNDRFIESLPGHLLPDIDSQGRLEIVLDRIKEIVEIK